MSPRHPFIVFATLASVVACGSSGVGAGAGAGADATDGGVSVLPDGATVPVDAQPTCLSTGAEMTSSCTTYFGASGSCSQGDSAQIAIDPTSTFVFAPDPRPALAFRSTSCGEPADACQLALTLILGEHVQAPPGGFDSVLTVSIQAKLQRGVAISLVPSTHSIGSMVESGTDVAGPSGGFTPSPVSLAFQNAHDPERKVPMTAATVVPIEASYHGQSSGFVALAFTIQFADGKTLKGALRAPWTNDSSAGCPTH